MNFAAFDADESQYRHADDAAPVDIKTISIISISLIYIYNLSQSSSVKPSMLSLVSFSLHSHSIDISCPVFFLIFFFKNVHRVVLTYIAAPRVHENKKTNANIAVSNSPPADSLAENTKQIRDNPPVLIPIPSM